MHISEEEFVCELLLPLKFISQNSKFEGNIDKFFLNPGEEAKMAKKAMIAAFVFLVLVVLLLWHGSVWKQAERSAVVKICQVVEKEVERYYQATDRLPESFSSRRGEWSLCQLVIARLTEVGFDSTEIRHSDNNPRYLYWRFYAVSLEKKRALDLREYVEISWEEFPNPPIKYSTLPALGG